MHVRSLDSFDEVRTTRLGTALSLTSALRAIAFATKVHRGQTV